VEGAGETGGGNEGVKEKRGVEKRGERRVKGRKDER